MSTRLRVWLCGWAALILQMIPAAAWAQPYPSRPIRTVIPFSAGGATDVVMRIIAQKLPDIVGQQVVIDNRTGAGGLIGTDIAAKSAPDGYTLLATGSPHVIRRTSTRASLSTR